ncbi:hypothetical protein [Neomicrococcus aestuarii]|uniref:Uncharacterized protein n=2 Tax=Neomicrococcus aestuarii TaxID=556325 RepID=A0A7W8TRH6_9MICC|nr:hypothetical protein [Neomicrococcus aestuarii]MBB5511577.1 hypothetical protein [Neomicrococcus aestuarii]
MITILKSPNWSWMIFATLFTLGIGACAPAQSTPTRDAEFTGSAVEYQTGFEQCLGGKGYEVSAGDAKGRPESVVVPVGVNTREESKAFFDAMEACTNELAPRPVVDTDAEVSAFYRKWIERWDCLAGQGYDVGSRLTEASFRDKFRDRTLNSTPQELLSTEQQENAYLACPISQDEFWG